MNDHNTDEMSKTMPQLSAEGLRRLIADHLDAADGDAEGLTFLGNVECAIALALATRRPCPPAAPWA